jgi:hypothetical protein
MAWTPISEEHLSSLIADAVAIMEPPARSLLALVRVRPVKWRLPPWGDQGGGFWVVGVLGERVVWYNDIEWGFNVSRYETHGLIAEYGCNQDELQHTMYALLWQFETGESPGRFGPPEPLVSDT